jgi:CubicO group peptidase (beta-lactamase class C family)
MKRRDLLAGLLPIAAPLAWAQQPGKMYHQLKEAIAFAQSAESKWPHSLRMPDGQFVTTYDLGEKAPDNEVLGPVTPRGGHAGIVYRGGKLLAEWGDTARADMTFSVAKSYLALIAGLALGDGLIKSLDDKAGDYALDDGFRSEQNRDITWRHLLTQTSEWQGTLFGKEDRIDHNRVVGLGVAEAPKGTPRLLKKPGTFYEYNDVRVNRLSYSLLQIFKEPLPSVLKQRIMDPIGASADWRWHGYRNSTVIIDGKEMISVPGGGHWGGGIVISARDLALMGLLVARGGSWNGKQILPKGWSEELLKPCPVAPFYGLMWWLNSNRRLFAAASEKSHFALGWGSHIVWIDPDNDLVTVLRWIDLEQAAGFVERLLGALGK